MQFIPKPVKKFQLGGAMELEPAPEETPQELPELGAQGGQDPLMQLAQGAAQALQSQDCNMAMQVCQALVQVVQQIAGQGGQESQGEPVFRKGGVLLRRVRK